VGPRAGLDPTGTRTPTSIVQPVASRYTDYAISAPQVCIIGPKNNMLMYSLSLVTDHFILKFRDTKCYRWVRSNVVD
jgi:hypothetical protein